MFETIQKIAKGVRYRMFPIANINEALGVDVAISSAMSAQIEHWTAMLHGDGLQLPGSIASELARLATIESEIVVTGSARADFLSAQLAPVLASLRTQLEFGAAQGGLICKPYLSGGAVYVDFAHADGFYPTAFDGAGRLRGVVFIEQVQKGDKLYRRLEYHHMEKMGCVIENRAFLTSALANSTVLGEPVPLACVEAWAALQPFVTIANVDRLLLGFFKMPFANTIDARSPLGVSAYARAVDLIAQADAQWKRILWEYEGTELAIHADPTMFQTNDKGVRTLPQGKERLYRVIQGLENKIEPFSPAIRDAPLFNGFNNMLKRIEFSCALAYGTLSDPQNVDKTAEEIKSSKQRSYSAVKDMQKAAQTMLENLLYAMDTWVSLASLAPAGAWEAAFDWGDSILNDQSERKAMFWQYVTSGKFPMWRYLMDFEGYTEADARAIANESSADMGEPRLGEG